MKKLPLGSLRAGEWTELFCLSHAVVVFLSVFYFLIKFGPGQYRHLLATIFGLVIGLYLVWIQGIVVLAIGTARLRAALQIGITNLANSQIIPFPHILSFLGRVQK